MLKDEAKVVFNIDKVLTQKELTLMQEPVIKKIKINKTMKDYLSVVKAINRGIGKLNEEDASKRSARASLRW